MSLKNKLVKLLDVKSIVTFALVGTLCFLAVRQDTQIPTELYTAVVTAVITYFFTRKADEKDGEPAEPMDTVSTGLIGFHAPKEEREDD